MAKKVETNLKKKKNERNENLMEEISKVEAKMEVSISSDFTLLKNELFVSFSVHRQKLHIKD